MRLPPWLAGVLAFARAAAAVEPCALDPGSGYVVAVQLTGAGDPLVAGAVLVIDHPEAKVGLAGEGIGVPKGTISSTPAGMTATANDLGDSVRIVLAQPQAIGLDRPVMEVHFQRCRGAPVPASREFSCAVTEAADPATNAVRDLGCVLTIP